VPTHNSSSHGTSEDKGGSPPGQRRLHSLVKRKPSSYEESPSLVNKKIISPDPTRLLLTPSFKGFMRESNDDISEPEKPAVVPQESVDREERPSKKKQAAMDKMISMLLTN